VADFDLSTVEFFEGFSAGELAQVRAIATQEDIPAGAVLMEQGRPALDCYVVCKGQAGVYVGGNHVATINPGSTVGEMAMIDHGPRSATVKALTDMDVLHFEAKRFRELMETIPKAGLRVMGLLNQRLRDQNLQGG
jgi:CRP/FNR family cyclic AMP-dependent transcriptional regulator